MDYSKHTGVLSLLHQAIDKWLFVGSLHWGHSCDLFIHFFIADLGLESISWYCDDIKLDPGTTMQACWCRVLVTSGGWGVSWCPSIRLLALCERNQAVTGGFPSLKASDAGLLYFFVMMSYGSSQFVFIFAQSVSSQVGNVADSIWRCKMTGDPIMQIRLA